jgi:surface protein
MPTLNYSFEELWGERGEGTSSISLTAGTTYNFLITSSIGAGYLTLETVRNYDGVTPKNTSGSYTALTNIASSVISDYIAGFSVPQGFSSFVYTPASNVVGSTLKLRGVGGVILGSGSNTPTPPPPTSATFQVDTTQTTVGSTANNVFKLPLTNNGVINFTIDWGDGNTDTITSYNQAETTHTYATSGVYEVAITSGVLRGWRFGGSGDRNKLIEIYDWSKWDFNVESAFRGCNNLISSATNTPTITSTTLNSMFSRANIFNGPIGGWDISGVTDLTLMFFSANVFNQDISSWDVSNVTQFDGMFSSASAFNQNIGGWNVSSSTNMDSMFGNALAFDQNIGSWNVRNVTDFNDFMLGKSPSNFSATNLDAIYNGWSALPSLQSSVTASFGNINYTAAGAAGRNTLVTTYNWLITDGGQI